MGFLSAIMYVEANKIFKIMTEMFGKYKYEYHKLRVDLNTPYFTNCS
jgi:hypothetical protein